MNGRDATPTPLTETDLTDVEEQYAEVKQKRTESLWDALVESIEKKRFSSVSKLASDPNAESLVPDLDDICNEV